MFLRTACLCLAFVILNSCSLRRSSAPADNLIDGVEEDLPSGSLGQQRSSSALVDPLAGGTLTLSSERGDLLTLQIPAGAVAEEVEVTVTWLAEPPESPLSGVAYALRFEPHGLEFVEPVILTVEHPKAFDAQQDLTLFYVESPQVALALTVDPITSATVAEIPHFSNFAAAPSGSYTEEMCAKAAMAQPSQTCAGSVPTVKSLLKCAALSQSSGADAESVQGWIDLASGLMLESFRTMRRQTIPEDDYCHRPGSQSGRYVSGLFYCLGDHAEGAGSAYLDEAHYEIMLAETKDVATFLAERWLESWPPTGDSCYKKGEVARWVEYQTCLHNSALHNLTPPRIAEDAMSDHALLGKVKVQEEFLSLPVPSQRSEKCGWYLECLAMHVEQSDLTGSVEPAAAQVSYDLEQRYAQVLPQCETLWDIEIKLDVTSHYELAGMEESLADYTVTVRFEEAEMLAEIANMQVASGSVTAPEGVKPGQKDMAGQPLKPPFLANLSSGGQFVQMSFQLSLADAALADIKDNGSTFTCHMPFACESITKFEVRKSTGTGMAAPKVRALVMRSLSNSPLSWTGQQLPANTGYFTWEVENMVELCQYDSEKSKWSCEKPTMGTMALPRPTEDNVVSDPLAPDFYFFNARLTAQQVKDILDSKPLSYSYQLDNVIDINDGAIKETQTQKVTVSMTPSK